jgi:polysaccharide deacetylase family protein (PEP-CTERM system associated)
MMNALTFDVEDYFHVHAFEGIFPRASWTSLSPRVVANTRLILQLLREYDIKATFFVLGWVAWQHPEIVCEIAAEGHELASHGFAHEAVYQLDPASFRDDVQSSLDAIRAACPEAHVRGYRAPSFSIDERVPWAFDILAELNVVYDSSVSPATYHDRYGMPSANRFAHLVGSGLLEIPLSTVCAFGCNWQVAGGGYFRLLPLRVTTWAIRRLNREGHPAVVYLHPWEFDPEQPRVSSARLRSRFRHYVNLRHTERRLRELLPQFQFGPISEVFAGRLREGGRQPSA